MQLKHRGTYSSRHRYVQQSNPSEFEVVSGSSKNMIGPRTRYRAATLSSLDFISQRPPELRLLIQRSDIIAWSILTRLSALRTLKSKCKLHCSALDWLTAKGVLGALKTLDVAIDYKSVSRHSGVLVGFLCSLLPLGNGLGSDVLSVHQI